MYDEECSSDSDLNWPRVGKRKRSSVVKKSSGNRRTSYTQHASRRKRFRISPSALQRVGKKLQDQDSFPVMCGDKQGVLHKAKFHKSEQCIFSGGSWFTPTQFEKFGGKEKNKKWKISIYHSNIPLQTFIHHRFLSSPSFKTKRLQDKKSVIKPRRSSRHMRIVDYRRFPSHSSLGSHSSADDSEYYDDDDNDDDVNNSDDDDDNGNEDVVNDDGNNEPYEEDDDDDDDDDNDDDDDGNEDVVNDDANNEADEKEEEEDDDDDDKDDDGNENVVNDDANNEADKKEEDDDDDDDDGFFKVTCSSGKGVLHKSRFATETCGKCIRTQDAWLTPKDFLERNKEDGNWRRDIRRRDKPLGELIMNGELELHSVNCKCPICTRELLHELDEKNDDLCYKCNHDGDLVCCNTCPRAFHHHCHNPQLLENMISEHWTCSYCQTSDPAARSLSS